MFSSFAVILEPGLRQRESGNRNDGFVCSYFLTSPSSLDPRESFQISLCEVGGWEKAMVTSKICSITLVSALKLKRLLKVMEKTLIRGCTGLECELI